jgi:hypothetical protein
MKNRDPLLSGLFNFFQFFKPWFSFRRFKIAFPDESGQAVAWQ